MTWQTRDYASTESGDVRVRYGGSPIHNLSVTTLLILANVGVYFFVNVLRTTPGMWFYDFGVMKAEAVLHGQIWRLLTATYLHANFGHIFFNMLGLYFFGPALERTWGRRQFFFVYTLGGIAGNVVLTIAGLVGFIDPHVEGLGASGSILALLGAAAVLFPNALVYIYFLFPMRLRTCVLLYGAWFVWNVFQKGSNYGGDLCHLGGMAVGVWWAWSGGWSLSGRHRVVRPPGSFWRRFFGRAPAQPAENPGAWRRRMEQRRQDEELIDRILKKVSREGIQSLTSAERRALEEATRRRREEEARLRSIGRD